MLHLPRQAPTSLSEGTGNFIQGPSTSGAPPEETITDENTDGGADAPTEWRQKRKKTIRVGATGIPIASRHSAAPKDADSVSMQIYVKVYTGAHAAYYGDYEAQPADGAPIVNTDRNPIPHASQFGCSGPLVSVEIAHGWSQERSNGNSIPAITTRRRRMLDPKDLDGYIGWLHIDDRCSSLERFANLSHTFLAQHVPRYVHNTIQSLLLKVRDTKEKRFIHGKFLVPGPIRYDGRLMHEKDRPCTFFSFPYLAVGDLDSSAKYLLAGESVIATRERLVPLLGATAPPMQDLQSHRKQKDRCVRSNHPPRMLFQSRYRLEPTTDRDNAQSIIGLSKSNVLGCIQIAQHDRPKMKGRKWNQKISVPQLWGLCVSGGKLQ
jgi:hypothetical protein